MSNKTSVARIKATRKWQKKNKERINARTRERIKNEPEFRKKRNESTKRWRENNREKYLLGKKINVLKTKYNLCIDEFNEMLKNQNNKCAICLISFTTEKGLEACVDHDHETGKVRGLLCHLCNRGIGFFKDDIDVISRVIKYLKNEI